jgi:hypothetical protein
MQKTQKKIEDHLISIHFGVKRFIVRITPQKELKGKKKQKALMLDVVIS